MKEALSVEDTLKLALEALEEIALAGMSPSPEMIDSKEAFHARQAWRFIGIAARALKPIKEALAQQSNEGFGYNIVKPYAFEAPNGELRKTAEAKDASEWGTKFKPLYEQQSNEQVEPVAVVDANDDGYFAEILPDRSVKVGQFLFAHPSVPTAQPKEPEQEPVVWMYQNKSTHEVRFQKNMRDFVDHGAWYEVPLYSEPLANHELQCVCGAVWCGDEMVHLPNKTSPQRTWVGLTEEDKQIAFDSTQEGGGFWEFADAIEAKLKEKNG